MWDWSEIIFYWPIMNFSFAISTFLLFVSDLIWSNIIVVERWTSVNVWNSSVKFSQDLIILVTLVSGIINLVKSVMCQISNPTFISCIWQQICFIAKILSISSNSHFFPMKVWENCLLWHNGEKSYMKLHSGFSRDPFFYVCTYPKIQRTKMLVTCQRFGDLFLFGRV